AVPVTFAGMAVTLPESPVTFDRNTQLDKETRRLRAQVARLEAKAEQLKRGDAQVLSMPATGKTASTATAATKAPAPVSTAEGQTPPRFVTIDLGAPTGGRP
ncbi:hypothetical protein QN397_23960, partial [Variovorax sp. RTB1]|uniref:hypothetical protein n=1 Tax=Variovorax sp. RTB1 TaxID=3048631 RepID=UPI002B233AAE